MNTRTTFIKAENGDTYAVDHIRKVFVRPLKDSTGFVVYGLIVGDSSPDRLVVCDDEIEANFVKEKIVQQMAKGVHIICCNQIKEDMENEYVKATVPEGGSYV